MTYRDVYLKQKQIPYNLFNGIEILYYTGSIKTNTSSIPDSFDRNKDIYISCLCDYKKYYQFKKIYKK